MRGRGAEARGDHGAHVDAGFQAGGEKSDAADLALDEEHVGRRNMPGLAVARGRRGLIAHEAKDAPVGKVEGPAARGLRDDEGDHPVDEIWMPAKGFLAEKPSLERGRLHRCPVTGKAGGQEPTIGLRGRCLNGARRAEVEKHDPPAVRLVPEIGEIRIGLHHAETEDLIENEIDETRRDAVALVLRAMHHGFDRHALHEGHGEDAVRREVRRQIRHHEGVVPGHKTPIGLKLGALAPIVGLLVKLRLGLIQKRGNVETARQQARHPKKRRDIVDISVDALPHAGILDLDRQLAPVERHRPVDLPDGGRGDGPVVEALEPIAPFTAPFGGKHPLELQRGHGIGIGTKPSEKLGEFGRQGVACIERDHLAELHRRTPKMGEAIGDPKEIAGGEHHIAHGRALALRQAARAFRQHSARQSARQPPELPEPRQAPAWHSTSPPPFVLPVHVPTTPRCPVHP